MSAQTDYVKKLEADRVAMARRIAYLKEAHYEAMARAARIAYEYKEAKRR